jgi:hypothetical protein
MILARGPFGKLPCKGENIVMGTGHTCSADRARDRVCRMLRGHGDFLLWEIKNPPARAGFLEKKWALPSLAPMRLARASGEDSFRYWMGRATPSWMRGLKENGPRCSLAVET